ncbi:hypothetical protein OSTOST_01244 [Ostertagia ostertagi]
MARNEGVIAPDSRPVPEQRPTRIAKTKAHEALRKLHQCETQDEGTEHPAVNHIYHRSPPLVAHILMMMLVLNQCEGHELGKHISCSNGTVNIHPPSSSFQLCFESTCRNFSANALPTHYLLPPSPTSEPIRVDVTSEYIRETRFCRAPSFCQHASHFLSKSLIANPHCWPTGALLSVAVIGYTILVGFGFLLWLVLRGKQKPATTVSNSTNIALQVVTPHQERIPFTLTSFKPALIQPSLSILLAAIAAGITGVSSCQEGYTRHSVDLICTGVSACHYEYRREILFNKVMTSLCVQLRHANTSVGYIKIRRRSVQLECAKNSLFWTRDTRHYVRHMTRCRGMGSCTNDKCETMAPSDSIPEMTDSLSDPGYNACSIECSGINCICPFPFRHCTFYRVAHTPISTQTYEVFACSAWLPMISLDVSVQLYNSQNNSRMTLHPYSTRKFSDFAFTVISIQTPHIPLNEKFALSRSEAVKLPREFTFPVTCRSEQQAQHNFSMCTNMHFCNCDISGTQPNCRCPHHSLSSLRRSSDFHLPLSTPHVTLARQKNTVIAESDESEIVVLIKSQRRLDSAHLNINAPCTITTGRLEGCYNCEHGSRINISCYAPVASWTTIACAQELFSIECGPENKTTEVKIAFNKAIVTSECYTTCENKNVSVKINGILYYHTQQAGLQDIFVHNTIRKIPQTDWLNDVHIPDLSPLWKVALDHWKLTITVVVALMTGIILTYICGPIVALLFVQMLGHITAISAQFTLASIQSARNSVVARVRGTATPPTTSHH